MEPNYIIEQFKNERKRQKKSQEDVADYCGVNVATISRTESLKTIPKIDIFIKMCESIGYALLISPVPDAFRKEEPIKEDAIIESKKVDYDNWDYDNDNII